MYILGTAIIVGTSNGVSAYINHWHVPGFLKLLLSMKSVCVCVCVCVCMWCVCASAPETMKN